MAPLEGLIGGSFARILEDHRERFNALFAAERAMRPDLSGDDFAAALAALAAPVVEAVEREDSGKAAAAGEAMFRLTLELLSKDLIGPRARSPVLNSYLATLLVGLSRHLAADPAGVAAELTNALVNLAFEPHARAAEWSWQMTRVGPLCQDHAGLLRAGEALSWINGLAQFREPALRALAALPAAAADLALGLASNAPIEPVLARLRSDPWFDPRRPRGENGLRIVRIIGGFRGFGGPFAAPPIVANSATGIYVFDREDCWSLHADAFGAVLARSDFPSWWPPPSCDECDVWEGLKRMAVSQELNGPIRLDEHGGVVAGRLTARFPQLAGASSQACTKHLLAATLPRSHRVYLIAAQEAG